MAELAQFFPGFAADQLAGGLGLAASERLTMSAHNGTHMDAPWHCHPTMDGGARAITIDEVPLDWCFQLGVKPDFRDMPHGHVVTAGEMAAALDAIGHERQPFDIVMVNTGAGAAYGGPGYLSKGRVADAYVEVVRDQRRRRVSQACSQHPANAGSASPAEQL